MVGNKKSGSGGNAYERYPDDRLFRVFGGVNIETKPRKVWIISKNYGL